MQENKIHDIEKKNPWPNLIAALFVLTSVGIAAYIGWQSYSLSNTSTELKVAIQTQKENLIKLQEREQIGQKMKAAQLLRKAKNYRKNWSVVLNDLNKAFTSTNAIKFNSVSVDNDNTVQVSAKARDFLTAAGFLVLVKRSDVFNNAFISRISPESSNESGGTTYNFNATFDYIKTPTTDTKTN